MLESISVTNSLFECFEMWIPTDLTTDQLEMELHRATVLNSALKDLIEGTMVLSEYLEFVEFLNIDIDNYLDEIEQNLESTPLVCLR